MRILVSGAGVLGSLYAARLKQSGQDVTILARQQRLVDIQEHGIVLEHALSRKKEVVRIPVAERLRKDDAYDLIVVLVRKNQIPSVLPILSSHHNTPNILFTVNNPSGYDNWASAVGPKRLVLGFAGSGGTRAGNVVRYTVVSRFLQPTTLEELDGSATPRVKEIMRIFRDAGFPVASTPNMDAWQKTRVAWIGPVAHAICMVNGDSHKLARSPYAVRLVARAVRECFQVLHSLGVLITPTKLQTWGRVPERLMGCFLRLWADTDHFRTIVVDHTLAAADKMWQLAEEFHTLALSTSIKTPAMDELRSFIPRSGHEGGDAWQSMLTEIRSQIASDT